MFRRRLRLIWVPSQMSPKHSIATTPTRGATTLPQDFNKLEIIFVTANGHKIRYVLYVVTEIQKVLNADSNLLR